MTVDSLIDAGSSLGELVAERPVRAQLFERLRLDYCCGGHQTLAAACIASEQTGTPVEEDVLEEHESEHATLGHALGALRMLCGDYDRRAALCNTHRALLDALEAFEQDLHRHVHEENNILLPRARQARPTPRAEARSPAPPDRPAASPSEALPACCEGWIAGQTHSWAAKQRGR